MILIKERRHNEILEMGKKWVTFKKRRNNKEFDLDQADGFITCLDRENMLDRIFMILKHDIERM